LEIFVTAFRRSAFGFLALAMLLAVFAIALTSTAKKSSLVYDEVIYAPVGLLYWKTGDMRWNAEHPPLQKYISSIPLLLQRCAIPLGLDPAVTDAWRAGYRILFQGTTSAVQSIFLMRLPSIALTLLLGWVLAWHIARRFGAPAAFVALSLFAFDPLVLGNGALSMNDIFVTAFFFFSVLAFDAGVRGETRLLRWAALSGVMAGLSVSSKFSGLLLLPTLGIVTLMALLENPKRWKLLFTGLAVTISIGFLVLLGVYRFHWNDLTHSLTAGLSFHSGAKNYGYLLKQIGPASGWFYYPVAVLIKTPLPYLFFVVLAGGIVVQTRSLWKTTAVFLAPIAVFWVVVLASRNHFGVRYLLPTAPFWAAFGGIAFAHIQKKSERWLAWGLVVWLAVEAAATHPNHMAYFNELIGGPKNGYRWLDGSNQDWGQDIPSLVALINKQKVKPAVYFGYWGSNRPEAWGLEYQDVFSPAITNRFRSETVNDPRAAREWLVVSAQLRMNRNTRNVYEWLKDRKPIAFVGNTLFVYDVTDDIESVRELRMIYGFMGRMSLVHRQEERLAYLEGLHR
jgi:4-amino-4-deoxy-L-arabinose transferase-like glycosyltransferase